eukprot:348404_1
MVNTVGCVFVILLLSVISCVYSACFDDLKHHDQQYWVWIRQRGNGMDGSVHESFNKYFPLDGGAIYEGESSTKTIKHHLKYKNRKRKIDIQFDFNNNNPGICHKLATYIDDGDAKNIIKLGEEFEITVKVTHWKTKTLKNAIIYIRPFHHTDVSILWVGNEDEDIRYKIYRNMDPYLPDNLKIDLFEPRYVFTKVRPLQQTSGRSNFKKFFTSGSASGGDIIDENFQIDFIKQYEGIVLFGAGRDYASQYSKAWSHREDMVNVHINNVIRHFKDGKSKTYDIVTETQKVSNIKSIKIDNSTYDVTGMFTDSYHWVSRFPNAAGLQRTWTERGILLDSEKRKTIRYIDGDENQLYVYHSNHHNENIRPLIRQKITKQYDDSRHGSQAVAIRNSNDIMKQYPPLHKPYEYVLVEYDTERMFLNGFDWDDKKNGYKVHDMKSTMTATIKLAQNQDFDPKIVLADLPVTVTYLDELFLFGAGVSPVKCAQNRDYTPLVDFNFAFIVYTAIRTECMINTVNAMVINLGLKNTQLWFTIGSAHGCVCKESCAKGNPMIQTHWAFLTDYTMRRLFTEKEPGVESYVLKDKTHLNWKFDPRRVKFDKNDLILNYAQMGYDEKLFGQSEYEYSQQNDYEYIHVVILSICLSFCLYAICIAISSVVCFIGAMCGYVVAKQNEKQVDDTRIIV